MKHLIVSLVRLAIFALICTAFWWASEARLTHTLNLCIIVGGVLLAYPLVWLGRKTLDRNPTVIRAVWVTTIVHLGVGLTFGVPLTRAIVTHHEWRGWVIPIPSEIGLALVTITGAATLLVVMILALKSFGAPAIALSRKLAVDWLYAWTRNPMVLAALALFVSLGIWFQSAMFVLWVLFIIAPALLFFVKVYEERELEIRFGTSYLEYKSQTPMLWPSRPRG